MTRRAGDAALAVVLAATFSSGPAAVLTTGERFSFEARPLRLPPIAGAAAISLASLALMLLL